MSKDIVNVDCSFMSLLGNFEYEAARYQNYFGGLGGPVCIVDVRRVIQVFQNCYQEIRIHPEVRV